MFQNHGNHKKSLEMEIYRKTPKMSEMCEIILRNHYISRKNHRRVVIITQLVFCYFEGFPYDLKNTFLYTGACF